MGGIFARMFNIGKVDEKNLHTIGGLQKRRDTEGLSEEGSNRLFDMQFDKMINTDDPKYLETLMNDDNFWNEYDKRNPAPVDTTSLETDLSRKETDAGDKSAEIQTKADRISKIDSEIRSLEAPKEEDYMEKDEDGNNKVGDGYQQAKAEYDKKMAELEEEGKTVEEEKKRLEDEKLQLEGEIENLQQQIEEANQKEENQNGMNNPSANDTPPISSNKIAATSNELAKFGEEEVAETPIRGGDTPKTNNEYQTAEDYARAMLSGKDIENIPPDMVNEISAKMQELKGEYGYNTDTADSIVTNDKTVNEPTTQETVDDMEVIGAKFKSIETEMNKLDENNSALKEEFKTATPERKEEIKEEVKKNNDEYSKLIHEQKELQANLPGREYTDDEISKMLENMVDNGDGTVTVQGKQKGTLLSDLSAIELAAEEKLGHSVIAKVQPPEETSKSDTVDKTEQNSAPVETETVRTEFDTPNATGYVETERSGKKETNINDVSQNAKEIYNKYIQQGKSPEIAASLTMRGIKGSVSGISDSDLEAIRSSLAKESTPPNRITE